jgi:hypothetical protein
MNGSASPLTIRRWASPTGAPFAEPVFVTDAGGPPESLRGASVILPTQGEDRARQHLSAGAAQVLVADAALLDAAQVARMAGEFGAGRIGVWVPARRMEVSWALDEVSNADFKCLVPSTPVASWEVLKSDLTRTGTEVGWWIAQMLAQGASTVLAGVDMADDRDLDICAGLVERFGDRLWFSPLADPEPDLLPWVRFGQVRRLVVPDGLFFESARLAALHDALQSSQEFVA